MASGNGKNTVSVGTWMWTMFVLGIPGIGFVMMLVWAFTGKNGTHRNYFRALIAWLVLVTALHLVLFATGVTAELDNRVDRWIRAYAAAREKEQQKAQGPSHRPPHAHDEQLPAAKAD